MKVVILWAMFMAFMDAVVSHPESTTTSATQTKRSKSDTFSFSELWKLLVCAPPQLKRNVNPTQRMAPPSRSYSRNIAIDLSRSRFHVPTLLCGPLKLHQPQPQPQPSEKEMKEALRKTYEEKREKERAARRRRSPPLDLSNTARRHKCDSTFDFDGSLPLNIEFNPFFSSDVSQSARGKFERISGHDSSSPSSDESTKSLEVDNAESDDSLRTRLAGERGRTAGVRALPRWGSRRSSSTSTTERSKSNLSRFSELRKLFTSRAPPQPKHNVNPMRRLTSLSRSNSRNVAMDLPRKGFHAPNLREGPLTASSSIQAPQPTPPQASRTASRRRPPPLVPPNIATHRKCDSTSSLDDTLSRNTESNPFFWSDVTRSARGRFEQISRYDSPSPTSDESLEVDYAESDDSLRTRLTGERGRTAGVGALHRWGSQRSSSTSTHFDAYVPPPDCKRPQHRHDRYGQYHAGSSSHHSAISGGSMEHQYAPSPNTIQYDGTRRNPLRGSNNS
ncbi:hypothetical protein SeLEV6574_g04467 [Synchytrium endobioticum]|nr:hypothetical protein SeLEV6574_g04467 [Synchytrium endobioticum]